MIQKTLTIQLSSSFIKGGSTPAPQKDKVVWIYFGDNGILKRQIQQQLGANSEERVISRELDSISRKIRGDYVRWMDEINRLHQTDDFWWFGPVPSRDNYRCNLFQYCCYLELLDNFWTEKHFIPDLIIIDSPALASAVYHWAEQKGIATRLQSRNSLHRGKKIQLVRFFLVWSKALFDLARRILASFMVFRIPVSEELQRKNPVIIKTFIHESHFSRTGKFQDKFFPCLHEEMKKNHRDTVIFPVLYGKIPSYKRLFEKMNSSGESFLIQEQFLSARDYLTAGLFPAKLLTKKSSFPEFHGHDISCMIQEIQITDDLPSLLNAILTFILIRRLKEDGMRFETIIDWFENQSHNKAVALGVHQEYPETTVIGAGLYIHYPNYLSQAPSQSEVEAGVIPDMILSTSEYQCSVTRMFTGSVPCLPAAALRYSHVFSEKNEPAAVINQRKTLLILTSYSAADTLELLTIVEALLDRIDPVLDIFVLFHPSINPDEFIRDTPYLSWNTRLSVFRGTVSEGFLLSPVILAKTSSSIIEALLQGIPVLFVANRNKINLNPMEGIESPLFTFCYTDAEILAGIDTYLNHPEEIVRQPKENDTSLRNQFFLPVNDVTLLPFFWRKTKTKEVFGVLKEVS